MRAPPALLLGLSGLIALLLLLAGGCGDGGAPAGSLRLATTTSTHDSGLLDVLLPVFEENNGCRVDVVAVGTGAALALGAAGDAGAVLVHAEAAERAFMEAGHGVRREPIMYNSFLLLGPPGDPAGARGQTIEGALRKIAAGRHRFLSRGDDSGTHKRELTLWESAGGRPEWKDYIEAGRGMGHTLIMASEMGGYVLADEGTWWKTAEKLELQPVVAEGSGLRNPYAVMVVSEDRTGGDDGLARRLADFLVSRDAQTLIRDYEVRGRRLFHPTRLDG